MNCSPGNRGKTRGNCSSVMAGLVPAIPIIGAPCPPDRDHRDVPGDDEPAATRFAPVASPALKWFIVLLLPLTLAWKFAVGPEVPDDLEFEIIKFLRNQHLEVISTNEMVNYLSIIQATSGSCRMLVAKIAPDGSSRDVIGGLATANDRLFIVFRGRVYAHQPVLFTEFRYLWSRFLRELGLVRHIPPVLAVVATTSCDAEQLPWDALHHQGVL